MKKLWFLLPLFVLLFGFCSKAETLDDVINYLNSEGFTISSNARSKLQSQVTAANNYYNNSFGIAYVLGGSGSSQAVNIGLVPKATVDLLTYSNGKWKYNNTNNNYNCQCTIYYCSGSNGNYTVNNEWLSDNNTSVNISMTPISKYGKYDFVPPIDWDNAFYSSNITAPVFEVYNAELNVVPTVDVPLSFDFQFVPSNTYVEIWADYTVPTELNVLPQPNNGAQYRVLDYMVNSVNVLDKEDLFESEALTSDYLHVILRNAWNTVLSNYPMTDIQFTSQGATSAWLDNKIAEYEDLRKTNTLYGSAIKIKVRYFAIVDSTKFVVGPWRIWDSKNPNTFTNELPSTYQVYLPASGTTGTNTDTSTSVEIPVGSGTPTGTYYDPNVNITVTQNVPNYPDYPTIVSYNKDNLLVDTMNWADNLRGFFGEFGDFLTDSFAFIPGWIWAIIGFGFSLSIVVMFLKIL